MPLLAPVPPGLVPARGLVRGLVLGLGLVPGQVLVVLELELLELLRLLLELLLPQPRCCRCLLGLPSRDA